MKSKILGPLLIASLAIAASAGLLASWNTPAKAKMTAPSPSEMHAKIKQTDIVRSVEKCGGWENGKSKVSSLFNHWDETGQRAMCIARCEPKGLHQEGDRHEWECGT